MYKVIILVVAIMTAATCSPDTGSEYIIPGTVSATCGPTLPQYTYCE